MTAEYLSPGCSNPAELGGSVMFNSDYRVVQ